MSGASAARRAGPWIGVLAGLVVLAVVAGGRGGDGPPLDPGSTGELGTKALVLLLERLGAEVDVAGRVGEHDVALLLGDDLDEAGRLLLDNWVRAGGTLVVADPGSPLAADPSAPGLLGGLVQAPLPPGRCDIAALDGIGRVDGGNAVAYEVLPGDRSCFGDGDTAFVLARDRGAGTVVSVGGAAAFTNGRLGSDDNAVLAAALLAPGTPTTVGFLDPPVAGAGRDELADLVADGVQLALVQAAVAFALYALWRAIRLGRPVLEPQPVQIDASELVEAVGSLLGDRRDPGAAAEIVAADAARAIGTDLGRSGAGDPDEVAAAVAARTGRPAAEVRRLLTAGDVRTDEELVRLTRELDDLRQEIRHGPRAQL